MAAPAPAFVRKIERARMNLGAHEQDALVHARFDKGVRYLKPVEKPCTLLPNVQAWNAGNPEFFL